MRLENFLLLVCCICSTVRARCSGGVLDDIQRHLRVMIADKRYHYSFVVSGFEDFNKFENDRVTFLRNTTGTKWFHKMQREIVISCKDERPDDHQIHIDLKMLGTHCGFTRCAADPSSQVIDNFNYDKRILLMIRSHTRRLRSHHGAYRYQDYQESQDQTLRKIKKKSLFVNLFSKTFLFIRGPALVHNTEKDTFKYSTKVEVILAKFFFDSAPTRGAPRIGCIEMRPLIDADYRQPFAIRGFNFSQRLFLGLRGINVNKGQSMKDRDGVECGDFDIIVGDCRRAEVSTRWICFARDSCQYSFAKRR